MTRRALAVLLASSVGLCAQPPATIPDGYRVETVPTPDGVAFGVGGLDFADDGRLFVSTREGQVWIYGSGEWTLFAQGLHEPLGILVEPRTDRVFVVQRPELTELIDADRDGRAERFETVCAAWGLTDNYHEYAYGLVRDADGAFYGTLNTTLSFPGWAGSDRWNIGRVHGGNMGRAARYRGWSFRITAAGGFEPWSSGLRSPAGIGFGADGLLLCTDNQGDWVASSCLHVLERGAFHGHPSSLIDHPDYAGRDLEGVSIDQFAQRRLPPAVYFPHGDLASSPGEPVLDDTGGRFGPFTGQVFIGDQTRSNVFRVVVERIGGVHQGCAINFVDHLQSGIVRSRFAPDGSLWVGQTGRGWGSRGVAQFGLQRLLWDGVTVPFAIESVGVVAGGFRVRFTRPVAEGTGRDAFGLASWRYAYHPKYGSPKLDGTDDVVTAIEAQGDRRTIFVAAPLREDRVYELTCTAVAENGAQLRNATAYYTLHRLPQ